MFCLQWVNVASFYDTPIATNLATTKIAIFATELLWESCLKFYFIFTLTDGVPLRTDQRTDKAESCFKCKRCIQEWVLSSQVDREYTYRTHFWICTFQWDMASSRNYRSYLGFSADIQVGKLRSSIRWDVARIQVGSSDRYPFHDRNIFPYLRNKMDSSPFFRVCFDYYQIESISWLWLWHKKAWLDMVEIFSFPSEYVT